MRTRAIVSAVALAAATVAVVLPAAPAGAAITVTATGTSVLATVTGSGVNTSVSCVGGQVRVGGVTSTPALACTAMTGLNLRGDDTPQVLDGRGAGSAFPALSVVILDMRGGADLAFGSPKQDLVLGGTGNDQLLLDATGPDESTVSLGGDAGDTVNLTATAADDTVTLETTSSTRTLVSAGAWSTQVFGTPFIGVGGGDGDDRVDAVGLSATTNVIGFSASGGEGDDLLLGGHPVSTLRGGPGDNRMEGGPGGDVIFSESRLDAINGLGGGDVIRDTGSGRVGDRAITTPLGPEDLWLVDLSGDTAVQSRNSVAGLVVVKASLARTGRQLLSTGISEIVYALDQSGDPADRVVLDLAPLPGRSQRVTATATHAFVDIVVPPLVSWSLTGATVTFGDGYGAIFVGGASHLINIRRRDVDPESLWAHRVLRDLEMRIPVISEEDVYQSQIEAGTRTRAQIATSLTSTDGYRSLAVDRAFVDVLRRTTDSAGRAYWIERLRDGLVTRRLRANLYGSPEYLSEQGGGTIPGYVAAAYRDILGRTAAPDEVAYWKGLIDVGTPRGTVADRFLNTPEARLVIIRDLYLRWTSREPTTDEIATWSPQLASSSTDGEVALIRALASGPDYFAANDP